VATLISLIFGMIRLVAMMVAVCFLVALAIGAIIGGVAMIGWLVSLLRFA
jgi:hypothetical protein